MQLRVLDVVGALSFGTPYLVAAVLVVCGHQKGQGLRPATTALGMVFLLTQVFIRPRLAFAIEAREQLKSEDDASDGPETPTRDFERQLRKIRGGEPPDRLRWRL